MTNRLSFSRFISSALIPVALCGTLVVPAASSAETDYMAGWTHYVPDMSDFAAFRNNPPQGCKKKTDTLIWCDDGQINNLPYVSGILQFQGNKLSSVSYKFPRLDDAQKFYSTLHGRIKQTDDGFIVEHPTKGTDLLPQVYFHKSFSLDLRQAYNGFSVKYSSVDPDLVRESLERTAETTLKIGGLSLGRSTESDFRKRLAASPNVKSQRYVVSQIKDFSSFDEPSWFSSSYEIAQNFWNFPGELSSDVVFGDYNRLGLIRITGRLANGPEVLEFLSGKFTEVDHFKLGSIEMATYTLNETCKKGELICPTLDYSTDSYNHIYRLTIHNTVSYLGQSNYAFEYYQRHNDSIKNQKKSMEDIFQ